MRMVELIEKKRDGDILTSEEITFFIAHYTDGEIPDYQASAMLMAIVLRGMSDQETRDMTMAMVRSGEQLDLNDVAPIVVDKHSTGGVGDKVSLVVAPTVAACGLPVGKMSGRGLGFSGGTLDKLESIPGYRCDLSVAEFKSQLAEIGIVLTGQSANLAPADGKLYALRDVTGTVPSMPLIVASIMSKKIAAGADAIVLDVKVGSGAFMRTLERANLLATSMVRIGEAVGRQVAAYVSDMNQPLGHAIGNSLEVIEAVRTLQGEGPPDFYEHCVVIGAEMLLLGGLVDSQEQGRARFERAIASGAGFAKFRELVEAQCGDVRYLDDTSHFPKAAVIKDVVAPVSGYLQAMQTDEIGLAAVALGAGRLKKGDPVQHDVGIVIPVSVGDAIKAGQSLMTIHANSESDWQQAAERILGAMTITSERCDPLPLFYNRITSYENSESVTERDSATD